MIKKVLLFLFSCFILILLFVAFPAKPPAPTLPSCNKKVLICGVCRNVSEAVKNDIANIEQLGNHCSDYAVIICEDNSRDKTAALFAKWARKNERVNFISEIYKDTHLCREERIARARNKVLKIASDEIYRDFDYLIMVDLDFKSPWPIEEILHTLNRPGEWDCVSSNGMQPDARYWDRYAFRNNLFPLGPELVGKTWWKILESSWFNMDPKEEAWRPAYSAFGGLAIYKKASITPFSYSGKVTPDLKEYYRKILPSIPPDNQQLQLYLEKIGLENSSDKRSIPIEFATDICCEHVPLHASMALHGFDKFFINPKLVMQYGGFDPSPKKSKIKRILARLKGSLN